MFAVEYGLDPLAVLFDFVALELHIEDSAIIGGDALAVIIPHLAMGGRRDGEVVDFRKCGWGGGWWLTYCSYDPVVCLHCLQIKLYAYPSSYMSIQQV